MRLRYRLHCIYLACMLAALTLGASLQAVRAEEIPIDPATPNVIGFGTGAYPDYFGSRNYLLGAAPIARISFGGERYATLLATDLQVNLVDHPNWRFGPAFFYRFGRDAGDDPVLDTMDDIDDALELGLFGGYTWIDSREPLKRAGVSAWSIWDVSGVHNGVTGGVRVFGMLPVARPVTLAAGAAMTWGSDDYMDTYFSVSPGDAAQSGLSAFTAGSGVRDARSWLVAMLHLSPHWHVGAGVMYSRLLGNASDSPIVTERGSADQWVYGAGVLYAW